MKAKIRVCFGHTTVGAIGHIKRVVVVLRLAKNARFVGSGYANTSEMKPIICVGLPLRVPHW